MSKTKQTVSRWISDFEQLERMASDARSSLEREQREWAQIRKEDPNVISKSEIQNIYHSKPLSEWWTLMEIHYPNLTQAHARYEATEREHANKRSEHQAALRREAVTVNAQLKTALTSFEASTSRMDQLKQEELKAHQAISTYQDNNLRMQADVWEQAAKSSLIFLLESPLYHDYTKDKGLFNNLAALVSPTVRAFQRQSYRYKEETGVSMVDAYASMPKRAVALEEAQMQINEALPEYERLEKVVSSLTAQSREINKGIENTLIPGSLDERLLIAKKDAVIQAIDMAASNARKGKPGMPVGISAYDEQAKKIHDAKLNVAKLGFQDLEQLIKVADSVESVVKKNLTSLKKVRDRSAKVAIDISPLKTAVSSFQTSASNTTKEMKTRRTRLAAAQPAVAAPAYSSGFTNNTQSYQTNYSSSSSSGDGFWFWMWYTHMMGDNHAHANVQQHLDAGVLPTTTLVDVTEMDSAQISQIDNRSSDFMSSLADNIDLSSVSSGSSSSFDIGTVTDLSSISAAVETVSSDTWSRVDSSPSYEPSYSSPSYESPSYSDSGSSGSSCGGSSCGGGGD